MATSQMTRLIQQLRRAALLRDGVGLTDGQLLQSFLARHDEAAFEILVHRHGAMVLGVCRRVLRNADDAEDAFQATFLVLVRKAATLVARDTIGNWLYSVAYHTALKARAAACRRRAKEREMPRPTALAESLWRDVLPLLDQELHRLPNKYREPIVLCDLEGKSRKEAARQLGWPEGTVAGRLARARAMLAERLARQGVTLSATALATALAHSAEAAAVPMPLVVSTSKAATALAAGQAAAAGVVSASVAALMEGVLQAMFLTKLKTVMAVLLTVSIVGTGVGALTIRTLATDTPTSQRQEEPVPTPSTEEKAAEPPPAPTEKGRLHGRFTAADTGKPVAGAKVKVLIEGASNGRGLAEALSGADGRYAIEVPLGHCHLWGVSAPVGYYTQASKTRGAILTTIAEPQVVRDFVLQPGSPWHVEVHGATTPADKPPFFWAWPNPERRIIASGESISVTGDARGNAVLTIPTAGGHYRFSCGLPHSPYGYEIPTVNLEIDTNFDPRQIKGPPEPLTERKAVRLRDAAGRVAVVEGAEVHVEAGQAVVRFQAQPIPSASAPVLRGTVVDEAGKSIKGAKCTAAFASAFTDGRSAAMSTFEATTDAEGKFEMPVALPESRYGPKRWVSIIVVKSGYDGAQTKELTLLEIKNTGSGDFGTVVLKPGRTLRGKVVDENARPVHGAVVTNKTNYFLYSHLQCRTDAEGRFVMPDLSFGSQKFEAQYGERGGQVEFQFDATSGECLITVRLIPKTGTRLSAPATPRAAPPPGANAPRSPVQPVQHDGAWDLTPPTREPKYQKEPRYALLVFGPKRATRVWMVLDGTTLYVDRNANGDLTEPDERLEPNNPKDGSNKFGGSGSHTHSDIFEFTVQAGATGTSKFRLDRWVRAENYTPKTDFEKKVYAERLALGYENSTLWRKEGRGQGQTPLIFMPKPADAHVCALDGPLTFVVKMPQYQVLQRGEAGCDVAFHIVVMGRPHRGVERQYYNPLATTEVPEGAYLEVEIEYPAKSPNAPPMRRKYQLKQRC
jgi:RNA polymerase sigma factor (sigma-70 family)